MALVFLHEIERDKMCKLWRQCNVSFSRLKLVRVQQTRTIILEESVMPKFHLRSDCLNGFTQKILNLVSDIDPFRHVRKL